MSLSDDGIFCDYLLQIPVALLFSIFFICIFPKKVCTKNTQDGYITIPKTPHSLHEYVSAGQEHIAIKIYTMV